MNLTKKATDIIDRIQYTYIRKIRKWIFCPNCQQSKMTIDKNSILWTCKGCGYTLSADALGDGYMYWFCDKGGSYLNNQEGFCMSASKHICKKCGFINDIQNNV